MFFWLLLLLLLLLFLKTFMRSSSYFFLQCSVYITKATVALICYSGTLLIWTPKGHDKMSALPGCPY